MHIYLSKKIESNEIWEELEAFVSKLYKKFPNADLCLSGEVSHKGWQGFQVHWKDKRQKQGTEDGL